MSYIKKQRAILTTVLIITAAGSQIMAQMIWNRAGGSVFVKAPADPDEVIIWNRV